MRIEYDVDENLFVDAVYRRSEKAKRLFVKSTMIRVAGVIWLIVILYDPFKSFLFPSFEPAFNSHGLHNGLLGILVSCAFFLLRIGVDFGFVILVSWVFIEFLVGRWVERQRSARKRLFIPGKRRIEVSDCGISYTSPAREERALWVGVEGVEQDDAYIYIVTQAPVWYFIPKGAFANAGDAETFCEKCSKGIEKSRRQVA